MNWLKHHKNLFGFLSFGEIAIKFSINIAVVLMLLSANAFAQQNTFESANKAYENENYATALEQYEQLIKEGYQSENLYYNLGNTYFKTGELGKSILYLEKAQKLAPRNKDIHHNLRFAYARTADNIEPLPHLFFVNWWFSLLNFFSASKWAVLGISLLWFAVILWGLYIFLKAKKVKLGSILFLSLSLVFLFLAYQKNNYDKDSNSAIILQKAVNTKSSPNHNAQEMGTIHEGLKVSVQDSVDNWYKIRLQDGSETWVKKEVLALI